MDNTKNEVAEAEGIFIGKPSKQDLINYFMKQQRIVTIKKMEETERDNSPDLSESFEIYLEQKKKKIESEKNIIDYQQHENKRENQTLAVSGSSRNKYNEGATYNDLSYSNDSFIELEKMCENTLNLNNVSEVLADLTSLELSNDSSFSDIKKQNHIEDTKQQQGELPLDNSSMINNEKSSNNVFDNNFSTVEATSSTLSYMTTISHFPSVTQSDKSEYYQTANNKSFELIEQFSNENLLNLNGEENKSLNLEKNSNPVLPPLNDTLDEIDFLLSQAQKINIPSELSSNIEQKSKTNTPLKRMNSPRSDRKKRIINTPKASPLISFSPIIENKSPLANFKCPKPISSSKNLQLSKINSKRFQHIVSPVSRYIQTSESVLNANAHFDYKKMGAKRQFNFRDSENFDQTHDISVKASSLPLRAKTNDLNAQLKKSSEKEKKQIQSKYKILSPITADKTDAGSLPRNAYKFFDNTLNDFEG